MFGSSPPRISLESLKRERVAFARDKENEADAQIWWEAWLAGSGNDRSEKADLALSDFRKRFPRTTA